MEGSKVKNSLLADGCVIEGTVENCVLFRGVPGQEGCCGQNCVLMQDTVVEANAELDYVVTDKNVQITAGKKLSGTESFPVYVPRTTASDFTELSIGAAPLPGSPSERGGGPVCPRLLFVKMVRAACKGGGGERKYPTI